MAFRSWRHRTKSLGRTLGKEPAAPETSEEETHLFEGDHSNQTAHAGHVGMIQTQQREDGVGLWEKREVGHGLNTN